MLTLTFDLPGGKLTLCGRLLENYLRKSDTLPLLSPLHSCVAETGYSAEQLQGHENSLLGMKEIGKKKYM